MATDTSRLDSLDTSGAKYEGHEALFAGGHMKQLVRLVFVGQGINDTQDLIQALAGSRIRSLTLVGEYLGNLAHPVFATLTELRIEALDLNLGFAADKLERFAFATRSIDAGHVDRLIAAVPAVRELNLDGHVVPGYRQLERAAFSNLRALRVHGDDIGYREAEAILEMPCAARLEVLQLKRIGEDDRARLEDRFGVVVEVHDASRSYVYWR